MPINTKFNIGNKAYLEEKAKDGLMSEVKIISQKTHQNSGTPSVKYQLYGSEIFQSTWYREDQLLTFLEAKAIVSQKIDTVISQFTQKRSELEGDFNLISSTLNII